MSSLWKFTSIINKEWNVYSVVGKAEEVSFADDVEILKKKPLVLLVKIKRRWECY